MDPPTSRSTLSLEHLLSEEMEVRKHGLRAWIRETKESAKNNFFGVRMRMQASSLVTALRHCSPTEQRGLLHDIESALNRDYANHREVDIGAVAAYYAIACDNHEAQGFKDSHKRVCELLESLPSPALAEVRDSVDIISEGKGFLSLVLTGGTAHYKALTQKFSQLPVTRGDTTRKCFKIISDIDDTCVANWIDVRGYSRFRWEPRTVYPGVRELHQQIISHVLGSSSKRSTNLVFLSLRPLRQQLLTIAELKSAGFGVPSSGNFTLLYGKFFASLTTHSMGEFKFQMFKLYSRLYPDMDYVFFGDSGQGDFLCAERMLNDQQEGAPRCRGMFIHEIRREGLRFNQVRLPAAAKNVRYFYHYGQAAKLALSIGLISEEGYTKVIEAFIIESRQLAAANRGDPAIILATFQESDASPFLNKQSP